MKNVKKLFVFLLIFVCAFVCFSFNVFAQFKTEYLSSSGKTAIYKVTSTVKYESITLTNVSGIAESKVLEWDGTKGKIQVTFSSNDCNGDLRIGYSPSEGCDNQVSGTCEEILTYAKSYAGKIPYEMGGKCASTDYATCQFNREWTGTYPHIPGVNSNAPGSDAHRAGNLKRFGGKSYTGLDCSGFVWWVFYKFGINLVPEAHWYTYKISKGPGNPAYSSAMLAGVTTIQSNNKLLTEILDINQVKPCDLVVSVKLEKIDGKANVPHIGIVTDTSSRPYTFVHENATDKNVGINNYFDKEALEAKKSVRYYRVKGIGDTSGSDSNTCSGFEDIHLDNSDRCSCDACDNIVVSPDYIDGLADINNCCIDGKSTLEEYEISQLFCSEEDSTTKVKYYKDQCNNDTYKDDKFNSVNNNNNYCDVYCTERVSVDTPGQIQSATGKFFKLAELTYTDLDGASQVTKAPVMEGAKRCTVKIQYDKWRSEYQSDIVNEVASYNYYQEAAAQVELLSDATKTQKSINNSIGYTCKKVKEVIVAKTGSFINSSGEAKVCNSDSGCKDYAAKDSNYLDSDGVEKTCTATACQKYYVDTQSPSVSCTTKYNEYTLTKGTASGDSRYVEYVQVQYNGSFTDGKSYDGLKITQKEIKKYTHKTTTVAGSTNDCATKASSNSTLQGYINDGYACSANSSPATYPEGSNFGDVDTELSTAKSSLRIHGDNFKTFQSAATAKEGAMEQCQKFFETGGDGDNTSYYAIHPNAKFKYMQVFLESTTKTDEWFEIPFGDATCVTKFDNTSDDGDVDPDLEYYSTNKYGKTPEKMQDLGATLNRASKFSEVNLDTDKEIKKKFRQDARYLAQCTWGAPPDVEEVTLYPGPQVSGMYGKTGTISYGSETVHKYSYAIYLTTYSASYETVWELGGDFGGSSRTTKKFIKAFNNAGSGSCAEQNIAFSNGDAEKNDNGIAKFTCVLSVKDGGMRIGTCDPGIGMDLCEENEEDIKEVFEFRVVDTKDLFPEGNVAGLANNWKKNDGSWGQVYTDIQSDGTNDKTYSPDNKTYSYKLTPTALKAIKDYNESRISHGGYDDFELDCTCEPTADEYDCGTLQPDNTKCFNADGSPKYTCKTCKSRFLSKLSASDSKVNGTSLGYSAWTGASDIGSIRNNRNHWAK